MKYLSYNKTRKYESERDNKYNEKKDKSTYVRNTNI